MQHPTLGLVALSALAALALGSSACAEVYEPMPREGVAITGNGLGGYRVYRNGENLGSEWAIRDQDRRPARRGRGRQGRLGARRFRRHGHHRRGGPRGRRHVVSDDAATNQNGFPTTMGDAGLALLIGGAVLLITGSFLQGAAHTHTFNAANMFNDDLAGGRVRVREVPVSVPPPTSSLANTHVAVYITPGPGYAPRAVDVAPALPR